MVKRKRIGLIFSYNENWIGGTYYVLNLIHSLKLLEDNLKPELVIFSSSEKDFDIIETIQYPYMRFEFLGSDDKRVRYTYLHRGVNKILRMFSVNFKFYLKPKFDINKLELDIVFPAIDDYLFKPIKTKIFWIPDFQEHYMPEFFNSKNVEHRKRKQKKIIKGKENIVFSSENAKEHFYEIYPNAKNKTNVLKFAVYHPRYDFIDKEKLFKEFSINQPYFFCSNQFWQHKNHKVILKALKIIKDKGEEILVVFSGKQYDYRNPAFFEEILEFVNKNKLDNSVRFLGFIDRKKQLALMKNSISIIQPSLFEGWSTVVEDVKAMNKYLILSNIEVHKEQAKQNVVFFDPRNEEELSGIMLKLAKETPKLMKLDYGKNRLNFAKKFIEITNV